MLRDIDIFQISKIEYAEFPTVADMYLYEIYYINLYKPQLNKDDKARDMLTVTLPEVEWKQFTSPLIEKWKTQIIDADAILKEKEAEKARISQKLHDIRASRRRGEISENEYWTIREEYENILKNLF